MKFLHNDKVSLGWAILVELIVHGFFALQAFLLGGLLGEIALKSIFGATISNWIGSVMLALIIGGASFQAFVLGEYMREHVESFENTAKGDGSYRRSWQQIRFVVAGLELSSLVFRCIVVWMQGDWQQAVVVLVLGLIMLWYAFAQAKVIHASVNRPPEQDVIRARDYAGRNIVKNAMELIPEMTTEQQRRFYTGDLSVVDEVETSQWQQQQEKMLPKRERRQKQRQSQEQQEQDRQIAEDYTSKLLGGNPPFLKAVPTDQADGNGNRRNA